MNESPTSTLEDQEEIQNQNSSQLSPSVTFNLPSKSPMMNESPHSSSPESSPSLLPRDSTIQQKKSPKRPVLPSRLSSALFNKQDENGSSTSTSSICLSPSDSPTSTLDAAPPSTSSPPTLQSPSPRRPYAHQTSAHSRSVSNASVGSNLSVPGMLSPTSSNTLDSIDNKDDNSDPTASSNSNTNTAGTTNSSIFSSSSTSNQQQQQPQRQFTSTSTSSPSRTPSPSTAMRKRGSHSRASSTHSLHSRSNSEYSEYKETLDAKSRDLEDGSRIINQYKMLNVIGQGAYGTVHRAVLVHGGDDGPEFVSACGLREESAEREEAKGSSNR